MVLLVCRLRGLEGFLSVWGQMRSADLRVSCVYKLSHRHHLVIASLVVIEVVAVEPPVLTGVLTSVWWSDVHTRSPWVVQSLKLIQLNILNCLKVNYI